MQKSVKPAQVGSGGSPPASASPKLKGLAGAGALAQRAHEVVKTMDEGIKTVHEMKAKQAKRRRFRVCCCGSRSCVVGPFTYEYEDDPAGGGE